MVADWEEDKDVIKKSWKLYVDEKDRMVNRALKSCIYDGFFLE